MVVAAEIAKSQLNAGRRRELYYFRDQQGLEVDFIMPAVQGGMRLVEAKASRTPVPDMADSMQRLATAWAKQRTTRKVAESLLVHRPSRGGTTSHALVPGIKAVPWTTFVTDVLA